MTADEFWKTYFAWQNGFLSEAEITRYEWIGRYAEMVANHTGTSILPYGLSEEELCDRNLWVTAGMLQVLMGSTVPDIY